MAEPRSSLRAVAHPLRLRILSLLTGAELSAAEVARELETTQANASYHLRRLEEAGLLEAAGEEIIRGGRAKRYRHPWRAHEHEDHGPEPARDPEDGRLYLEAAFQEAARRQLLKRPRGRESVTDAELWVDPEVWREAFDHVIAAAELLHDRARPPHTEGTVQVNMTAVLFEMIGDGR